MKDEGIAWHGSSNQPAHRIHDILSRRDEKRLSLIIGEHDHCIPRINESIGRAQELFQVADVVDTARELSGLVKVVNPDEEGFFSA